ncbi:MAG TPA: CHAT domain-containing protein [Pyrinomonadaceae bacterium]|jgi:CHAT domain-containing protein
MSSSTLNNSRRSPKPTPDLTRRRRLAPLSLCLPLLSACLLSCAADRLAVAQATRPRTQQARPLEREIAGSEMHSYGVTSTPGQLIRAFFEQRGVDVVITLLDPEGQELQRVDNPAAGSWGPEPLFFEVGRGGRYFIQVRPRSPSAPPGRYLFGIESRRAAAGDKGTFPAERAFAEAARLLADSAGNRREAEAKYEEALRLFRAARDLRGEVLTLSTIASTRASAGDEQGALPFFAEALRLQTSRGDEGGAAFTRSEIARAYLSLGDRDRALEYLEAARRGFLAAGDRRMAAYTYAHAGAVHDSMGEQKEALAAYERALPLFREAEDRQGEASALNNIGLAYDSLGEKRRAHDSYTRALALIHSEAKLCHALAPALSNVAFGALDAGDRLKALEYLEQALALQRAGGDREGEARTLNNLGFVYNSLGERRKALEYLGRALAVNREVGSREGEGDAFGNLMFTWRAGGRPQAAIFYGKQAVNVYQEVRRQKASLDREAQRSFVRSRENTYQQLADLLIARNRLLEAQQVLGLLKEEEYFQYVRRDGNEASGLKGRAALNPAESDLEKRYRDISEALPALARRRGELEAKRPNLTADETLQLDRINSDLSIADQAFQKFVAQMSDELPDSQRGGAAFAGEDSQGIVEDLRQLGPGVAAVYTSIGEEKYRAIVFTKDIKAGREYAIKSADLYKKIFAFRQALEDPRSDPRPHAQELYRILVGPVADILKGAQVETVMWSLTGPLRYVPVAALHDGEKYLVERYRNTVFTPVNTSHLTDAPGGGWRGLGVGVSKALGQFPALPDVPRELHGIFRDEDVAPGARGVISGKVFLDETFTAETFFAQLRQRHPVVHIASHFRFQPGNVTNSFLLLGNGEELSLARIRATPNVFGGVDLLALSACETATTGEDADGKEVEGFAVLAQQRGARSVLASLWPVADKSTPLLMEKFYQLRGANPRDSKAEALRAAQLSLLRDNPSFSHPYFWAPFILIGNWR